MVLQRESGRADRSLTQGASRADKTEARRWRRCQYQGPLRRSLGVGGDPSRDAAPVGDMDDLCGRDGWIGSSGRPRQWDGSVHCGLTKATVGISEGRTRFFHHCTFEMCMLSRSDGSEGIYLHGRWRCAVGEGGKGTEIGKAKI